MPVIQEAFDVPDNIAVGLATGLYKLYGGVVRYANGSKKGQIVKHLKPVDLKNAGDSAGLAERAFKFAKEHKKGTAIIAAGALIVGSGVYVYNKVKNREPEVVSKYRNALGKYIEALRKGNMDIETINALTIALENLRKDKDYKNLSVKLSAEELDVLVSRIYDYTVKLAKDNDIDLTAADLQACKEIDEGEVVIVNLLNYLKAQKMVFESAV